MKTRIFMFMLSITTTLTSCKKLIEVDGPITSVNSANIYESDATASSVLTALYGKLSSDGLTSGVATSVTVLSGLSADEFKLNNTQVDQKLVAYYNNALNGQIAGYEFWNNIYSDIYVVNAALEGIDNSKKLTIGVKQRLLGECHFIRAYYFFYLVNLYGDVPLTITTDYKLNAVMPRTDKKLVWNQIIDDLKQAQILLDERYLDGAIFKEVIEKVRPNRVTATALLARAYLYTNDWQNAETQASSIISNSKYSLVTLDDVFKRNSNEAIWQLQPVLSKTFNTVEASLFAIDLTTPEGALAARPVFLNLSLLNDFDIGDQRKTHWINSVMVNGDTYYYPYKYKVRPSDASGSTVTEYSTVFRLAEQYLIRAEARIHLNKIHDGIADLNTLRDRATDKNLGAVPLAQLSDVIDISDALQLVEHERRTELFTESGHRWLDLKRTGRVDAIMNNAVPEKTPGQSWKSYQQWYPIESRQIGLNPNLKQNIGF